MALVSFGQPENGIVQTAYVVEDIHRAIETWSAKLRVGPWFLLDSFIGVDPLYRGQPSRASVSLAMGFAGHMMMELIQPLDEEPSVYREVILKRGYGFHHWGVAAKDFDAELARYHSAGYETAFSLKVPTGGRVAYMDTMADLPGMVELIELGADFDAVFSGFYRASLNWDGKDPVRRFA